MLLFVLELYVVCMYDVNMEVDDFFIDILVSNRQTSGGDC